MKNYLRNYIAIVFLMSGTASCTQDAATMKMGDLYKSKEEWPLEGIEEFTLDCVDGDRLILKTTDGKVYALNGTAKTASEKYGWLKEDAIHTPGKDISPIMDRAKMICEDSK